MAAESTGRGWAVLGTVRAAEPRCTASRERPKASEIESSDIRHDQMLALRDRLTGRRFDVFFVNAGIVIERHRTRWPAFPRTSSCASW